jgi:DNA polymerase-3 subunit delta
MTLFFYGPNRYAMKLQLDQMIDAYLKKAGSDFGLERIDGGAVKAKELAATLMAVPFLASSRLIIIDGVATNKPVAEKLPGLMAAVPATTVVVFTERTVDQRTTAYRTLMLADKVVKFEPLTGSKLIAWVRSEAAKLGGQIEPAAASRLVELAGEDQWRLSGEINKLIHFTPEVNVSAVDELVVPSIEKSIFDLVEAMAAGRARLAFEHFLALLKQKENEIYVLTMIQWQLRNLLLAKTAPGGMTPAELAREVGMSPYVAGKMMAAQNRLSEAALTRAYVLAADCEFDIKTGRIKGEPAVEQLIWRVAELSANGTG